jgi:xanthine dehydrogenase accessory factor
VWREAFAGTVGGGHLEFKALEIARGLLDGPAGLDVRRFALGASLGQCCGGAATLLFEPVAIRAAWLDAALAATRDGVAHVVATAARSGTKAVVTAQAVTGEAPAPLIAAARAHLDVHAAASVDLEGERWLLEPSPRPALHVVLFGAGHVGRALAGVLGALPCSVVWVDGRDGAFPAEVAANIRIEATDTPLAEVRAAPPDTCFLVMTHSHALDFELGEAILARGDFRFFGLIGSRTKRRSFEQRLARRGVDAARLTCPIGVPGVGGKEPEVIAVAVAAQLFQLRGAAAVSAAVPARAG